MEVAGVLLAAGLGALSFVGSTLVGSSEGMKVLVDPDKSDVESVFATIERYVHC